MSVQPSHLKCPSCTDQLLETVTTALGSLERCPSCLSLWIEQKLIAAYSDDKTTCRDALAETQSLLLSTERWCPKCFQKMVDGRVRSRGVVLHLCVTCEALWIDWETLRKFDEFIERALRAQVEAASQAPYSPQAPAGSAYVSGSAPPPAWTQIEDTSMGKVFRSIARTFDSIADGVGGTSAYTNPKAPKPAAKKPPVKAPLAKTPKEPIKDDKERKILKADGPPPDPIVRGTGTAGADTQAPAAPEPINIGAGTAGANTQAPAAPEPMNIGAGTAGANTQAPAAANLIQPEAQAPAAEPPATVPSEPLASDEAMDLGERAPDIPLVDLSAPLEPEQVEEAPASPPAAEEKVAPVVPEKVSHVSDFRSILETLEEQERAAEIPEPEPPAVEAPILLPAAEIKPPEPVAQKVGPVAPAPAVPEPVPAHIQETPITKIEPEPVTEPIDVKAAPEKEPENVRASSSISDLLGGTWEDEEEPAKKVKKPAVRPGPAPANKPAAVVPAGKPMLSKPEKGPGIFGKLAAAMKPKPKTPKPVAPVAATPPAPVANVKAPSAPAPVIKVAAATKPVLSKSEKGPGIFGKFAAAMKPKPKMPKSVLPIASAPSAPAGEIKKTAPASIVIAKTLAHSAAAPVPKTVEPKIPKEKGPGISAKVFGLFKSKPKPKPAKPAPVSPAPVGLKTPTAAPTQAEETPKIAATKPPAVKPVAKVKVVRPKTKGGAGVWGLRILPWALAIVAFLINYARGYDFELSFALLWSACAWSVGTMVRLALLYPFQDFMEITLAALLDYPGLTPAKGFPVLLKGVLEPENSAIPKGPLRLVQDEKNLLLNKTGALDLIANFFGLKNPGQLAPGDVELRGWYRNTEPPSLEISVALLGKKRRASSVRGVRWAAAIAILAVAGLILMTAE